MLNLKKLKRNWLITILVIFTANIAAAENSFVINEIRFVGLAKTKAFVLERELKITPNQPTTEAAILAGIQRIKNLRIFGNVGYRIETTAKTNTLIVSLDEKWTTIPIAKFGSGGGVNQLILGAYDVNLGGRYLEAGAQYERFGEENSGVLWFRNPRLLDQDLELFVSYWDIRRARFLYNEGSANQEQAKSFVLKRRQASISLEKQFMPKVRLGISLKNNDDAFSNQENSPALSLLATEASTAKTSRALLAGVTAKLGLLNYNEFLVDGTRLDLSVQHADEALASTSTITQANATLLWYKTIGRQNTLAARFMLGAADTTNVQYYYYLGGLDRLRGFVDSRFYAKNFYLLNLEYRLPTYRSDWLVVQNTAFYDAAGISDALDSDLLRTHASSIGTGLRFISPKIYRLTFRLDYARSLVNQGTAPISFGVQQFF